MKTIKQFPVSSAATFSASVPIGSELLTIRNQSGKLVVWAICESTESQMETWTFQMLGKGDTVSANLNYVTTITFNGVKQIFREANILPSRGRRTR